MSKKIFYGEDARKKLLSGIDAVADVVGSTIGPKGKNVILERDFGAPLITNDGVTIAKEIELEDPVENMGAQLLKEVASKTNDVAGDGTTTATILARAIIKEGLKSIAAGASGIQIKRGINAASEDIVKELKKLAKPIHTKEEIQQVATISANDPDVGKIIADAMTKVGKDGVITTDDSQTIGLSLKIVKGLQFNKGYISQYFVTNQETLDIDLENANVLIVDGKVSSNKDLLPILEKIAQLKNPCLIIADDVEAEPLTTLVVNKLRGILNVVAVKAPEFGDNRKHVLNDIAAVTGATVIDPQRGITLENAVVEMLGEAKKIKITKDSTTIIDGKGTKENIVKRKAAIQTQIEKATSEYDKAYLKDRLGKINGGVAVIQVGSPTETEQKELKLRIEDSLNATKAAVEEGVVIGGGAALVYCNFVINTKFNNDYSNYSIGYKAVVDALLEPLKLIAKNSGDEGVVVANNVTNMVAEAFCKNETDFWAYDASNNAYADIANNGIVDPVKVTRSALQNAASVAGMVLTTDAIVSTIKAEGKKLLN